MRAVPVYSSALLALLFCVSPGSCEDPLPPYQKPENVFDAGFVSIDTFLVRYRGIFDYPQVFWYTESPPFTFVLQIENTYEETVQSVADIQGKLEIWLPGRPEFRATLPLSSSNALYLNSSTILDPATFILTLNPHQKLYLKTVWDYRLDDGKWINEILENYRDQAEGHKTYRVHAPTLLDARMTIQLIKNTAPLIADTGFVLSAKGLMVYRP